MPNHLFGLRDMDTKRDYFVGANCMSRLSQMLVLERPFESRNPGEGVEGVARLVVAERLDDGAAEIVLAAANLLQ